jgi:2-succinyl-5-enolpyruvyl-6-hydroxy-3-cyclohexene-1-carboxylate synthase
MTAASNLHLAWARLFVRALATAGVTDAVLSPGSRSAPLAIALAEELGLSLHVVVDERSAAFFALGQARVTGRPSLLVCTSGTAGAHYLPAVIEASQSFLPMLVVTADRPWELYDVAAPQTIDQAHLFGGFARHRAELGLPDSAPSALRAVPRIAAQAVARAFGPTPGPVHVNARFRKPLEPVEVKGPEPWEPLVESLRERAAPTFHASSAAPDARAAGDVAARIARASFGLIACGPAPLAQGDGRDAILELARRTGFPLLAESTSQVRFGGDRAGVVECGPFDAVLAGRAFRDAPDLVLQFGAPPTSSTYADLCANGRAERVVVAPHGWNDPESSAALLVAADPVLFARALARELPSPGRQSVWSQAFARAATVAEKLADRAIADAPLSEGAIARAVVDSSPEGALLVVGNSTPVRDLDVFCPPSEKVLGVVHQRGVSGIDGIVSGAAGAASRAGRPVAVLLGDLALLHDLGGLGLAAKADGPLAIVVVQNGGGRIFEQLPVAGRIEAGLFERCFATRQDVRFEHAAAAFGVPYAHATTASALDAALGAAWKRHGATLIEAVAQPGGRARMLGHIRSSTEKAEDSGALSTTHRKAPS